MKAATPAQSDTAPEAAAPVRSRDAGGTRRRLLEAARGRFARDGYSATTVREIAADAGVNVALINRYFESKEGLFETCLRQAVKDLDPSAPEDVTVTQTVDRILDQIADQPTADNSLQLLLLLRSSGDERADQIRRRTLVTFSEGLARVGGRNGDAEDDDILLRAQVALAAIMGITLLRSSTDLGFLTAASAEDLRGPVTDILTTLLTRAGSGGGAAREHDKPADVV